MLILTRSLGAAAAVLLLVSTSVLAQVRTGRPRVTEGAAQRLQRLEPLIANAMTQQRLPGAVVLVGGPDRTLYQKAFGRRAIVPSPEAMTTDTIFDVASLTKVVVTTTSVMMLLERGQLGLDEPVATYIPEFGKYGKERITIRHLLTHVSGLRGDLDMALEFQGAEAAIRLAAEEVPVAPPGARLIYSDINFFLLGEIVTRISGERLDAFARTHIFEPLAMRETTFLPTASLRPRIAPTEPCAPLAWPCGGPPQLMLRGVVHDPTARRMGGVAGHAGLFSTAADLSRFCR
ncbi:MAG TPA: serine hydrolase domain-containing protein, partial [Vicinamibacterales bacterium]|nr:serine hydrolase domain-containing protein [Vicinamibacterales bacterium]